MSQYVPKIERSGIEFTISTDFTGTDGALNRTYTLAYETSVLEGMSILHNSLPLQPNVTNGFTFASGVITFTVHVADDDDITINYNVVSTSSVGAGDTPYATTEQLSEFMVMIGEIPNPQTTSDPRTLEEVGTGDNATTRFYTDNAYILADTYTFYYGASEGASLSNPLSETTHYTFDKDLGTLTLTTAGVTLIGTNKIYAAYKYNNLGFKDSQLRDQLNRAAGKIEEKTSTYWIDGTADTPDWKVVSDEEHRGGGAFRRSYFLNSIPLPDVSTNLSSASNIGDTTLNVDSTDGFPSSGTISIDSEKITYSSKTDTTFTVTALTSAHVDNSAVYPWCFEASNTLEGATPTWTVLSEGDDYHLDKDNGRVYFSATGLNVTDAQAYDLNPPKGIPERFRASYIWGNETIPDDINQLCLMIASSDLLHRAVRKAHVNGLNDYTPDLVNVDEAWIKDTIRSYKRAKMACTVGRGV